jgi:hypothetical protein
VELIVQAQTADSSDILMSQGCKQQPNVCNIVGNIMLSKDVSPDDAGLFGLADVAHSARKYGVTIVSAAVPGEKANESL